MKTVEVDELLVGYCDSNKRVEVKQDIARSFFTENPERLEWYKQECLQLLPNFRSYTNILMRLYNQTGGTVCNMLQPV